MYEDKGHQCDCVVLTGVRRHVMPAMREAGLPDFPVCMAESFTTPPGKVTHLIHSSSEDSGLTKITTGHTTYTHNKLIH